MSPAAHLSRRTTLGCTLVGAAALGGCDLGDPDPASTPTPSAEGSDPDAALVEVVVDDVVAASVLVEALRDRHASLRRPLADLGRVHDAHLAALGPREPEGRRPPPTRNAADALDLVRRRELRHQRLLADRALSAQSGRLARLLASMSAAVAQQLALLPDRETR